MILVRFVAFAVRSMFRTGVLAASTGYRAGRLIGYRRIFGFGSGLAAGLLVAPMTGRELRARLHRLIEGEAAFPPATATPVPGRAPLVVADEVVVSGNGEAR
ncbi:hypothetical protein BH20ACT2_BH20ACT2_21690 [soil metagenome]